MQMANSLPDIGNQKSGFSLAEAFLVLQNAQKATISLVHKTKNLVSLRVSGSEMANGELQNQTWGGMRWLRH